MIKEEPLNVTHLGWRSFILGNHGKLVAYMDHFPGARDGSKDPSRLPFYISYVDIPDVLDVIDKVKQTIYFWAISIRHYYPYDTEYHINDARVSKEVFISTLAEEYPTHLKWLLFHPEWFSRPCRKE
jgi:hypothetical protein